MGSLKHHLYVHVPFCRLVCAYCDFVTVGGRADDIPRYTNALIAEINARPAPGELRTIYFGGGTPSLLTGPQAERVIRAATDRWERAVVEEISVEANPSQREMPDWGASGTRRQELFAAYAELGVSRVMGLLHAFAESDDALEELAADVKAAGAELSA